MTLYMRIIEFSVPLQVIYKERCHGMDLVVDRAQPDDLLVREVDTIVEHGLDFVDEDKRGSNKWRNCYGGGKRGSNEWGNCYRGVSLCNKVYAQEIEDEKAIDYHELIDEENLQLNSATAGRMNLHHRPVHQTWRQFLVSQMKFKVNQRSTMMQRKAEDSRSVLNWSAFGS
ncbi:uncharacterized protein LOC114286214 isoform X2 [Camellia sinensis]|uniref:uncharacterized protein LOC114286214 isoform X2 n=1 Tax=Camellia sinensis TaxID=4442 RepID=UPI001035CC4F|nr:uncharacterized protein LOC114286214 isoform X2 [Camellia sinensis]